MVITRLISEPAAVFTPPWFSQKDSYFFKVFVLNLESSLFFFSIRKYFLTRHHLLKDAQVEEVHEGEQTSSKATKNVAKDDIQSRKPSYLYWVKNTVYLLIICGMKVFVQSES